MDNILFNIYFWLIASPIFAYIILMLIVKATGKPVGLRGFPIISRFFKTKIRVLEVRSDGKFKKVETYGRRVELPDKTLIFETIKYGDIKPPALTMTNVAEGYDWVDFIMPAPGEFLPISVEPMKEEIMKIPVKDDHGIAKLYPDGTPMMKEIKMYKYRPWSQEQRMFYKNQYQVGMAKYKKSSDFLEKILPYVGILLMGIIIVILLAVLMQNIGTIADKLSTAHLCSATQTVQQTAQNFTY